MLYLSQLLGAPVEDLHGMRIGKINDIVVPVGATLVVARPSGETPSLAVAQPEPVYASALLIEGSTDQLWCVPIEAVEWDGNILHLRIPLEQLTTQPTVPSIQEVHLAQEVLDKQVIDIVRKKAVRVNDVSLGEDWQILGVDTTSLGLLRRLVPTWLLRTLEARRSTLAALIPWEQIELIGSVEVGTHKDTRSIAPNELEASPQTPRPQSGHLAELHPADIAEIVHQLTPGQGARLIEGLDDETAADTMEEIDTERQRHILENIQADRAADILEAMGPDEAADLLAQLPEERAQQLLSLMTPEESEDVQELLAYEENSAGGLMTTDYIILNATRNVAEALEAVRSNIREDLRSAYVYCVADETQDECPLLGVVSIWDLLVAVPTQSLQELMETDVITVQPDTDPRAVAEIMAKYNLLAVPVVSAEGFLEGVVTVDDALDVLLPVERRRKPTRMY